jgi:hypothetical protein
MDRLKQWLKTGFALILLGIPGWGGFVLIEKLAATLPSIDSNLAAGLVAASATIIVSVLSITISKLWERKTAIEKEIREKKSPVYEGLINFIFGFMFAEKLGKKPPSEKELMTRIVPELIIWGAPEVVKAFADFRKLSLAENREEPFDTLFAVENIYLAIRRDLGHRDTQLKKGDILVLFINDIIKHL